MELANGYKVCLISLKFTYQSQDCWQDIKISGILCLPKMVTKTPGYLVPSQAYLIGLG